MASVIFTPQQVRAILAGRKRQFRIPREPGHDCPYEVGHSYVAQRHRGEEEAPRFRVHAIREQLLHELTEEEARLEGFKSRAKFMAAWWDKYRNGCGPGPPTMPWVELPIWVIEFDLDREHRPRLLTSSVVAGRRGPYTDNPREALDEEAGEAIDAPTQQRFSREAHERDEHREIRARRERQVQDLSERLEELLEAERRGEDVQRDLARVRQALDVADKKRRRRGTLK